MGWDWVRAGCGIHDVVAGQLNYQLLKVSVTTSYILDKREYKYKYFSHFSTKNMLLGIHLKHFGEQLQISTHNMLLWRNKKNINFC